MRATASLKGYPADIVNADGSVTKADQNAVTTWRSAMGVPATPADYKLTPPKDTPYPQFTGYLAEVLHEAGTPPGMAAKLAQGYEAAVVRLETELRAKEDGESAEALKRLEADGARTIRSASFSAGRGKEWLAKEVGGLNESQMRTLEAVLGTSKFMSVMWKFGAGNREASFPGGDGGGARPFEGGVSQAQAEYAQLMADRSSGKINDAQWRTTGAKREQELANLIAAGNAPMN